uniref:Uncharacterized protein n=1 Tax=Timema poppense TaxID=170557 RepID=A0A7R9HBR5_TIMPO|nr:unnamed protein product [Timema poppensis]
MVHCMKGEARASRPRTSRARTIVRHPRSLDQRPEPHSSANAIIRRWLNFTAPQSLTNIWAAATDPRPASPQTSPRGRSLRQGLGSPALYDKPSGTYKEVKTLISKSESGEWNLLCRMLIGDNSDEASFCRFLHPNGTGLVMTDGVGNSQYSYYGEGLNSKLYRDCGITIHKPTVADNGVWNYGFIQPIRSRVSGSANMIVMESTILELYCQIDAILDYCWFLRPNGSHFVPDYDAANLKLGKCSASTVQMNRNDSGEWVCNMGIMGHPEGDSKHSFNVTVATSRLMAKNAHQKAKLKESTTIHCITAPAAKTLSYCRFVRPDGVGISPARTSRTILDRYKSTGGGLEKGDCLLTIDEVTSRDFGHWRCAAVIQGEYEEIYDHFTLSQSEGEQNGKGVFT